MSSGVDASCEATDNRETTRGKLRSELKRYLAGVPRAGPGPDDGNRGRPEQTFLTSTPEYRWWVWDLSETAGIADLPEGQQGEVTGLGPAEQAPGAGSRVAQLRLQGRTHPTQPRDELLGIGWFLLVCGRTRAAAPQESSSTRDTQQRRQNNGIKGCHHPVLSRGQGPAGGTARTVGPAGDACRPDLALLTIIRRRQTAIGSAPPTKPGASYLCRRTAGYWHPPCEREHYGTLARPKSR